MIKMRVYVVIRHTSSGGELVGVYQSLVAAEAVMAQNPNDLFTITGTNLK